MSRVLFLVIDHSVLKKLGVIEDILDAERDFLADWREWLAFHGCRHIRSVLI